MPVFLTPADYPLVIDGNGNAESVPVEFDFSDHWEIVANKDSLASSPAPTIASVPPEDVTANLTIGSATRVGNIWTAQIGIVGGNVGSLYQATCRAQTVNGSWLVRQVNIQLEGVG